MACETYQVTWGWSPIDDPKKITWFLPSVSLPLPLVSYISNISEGTNIEYNRTYDFGASEKWEAQLDENNEFTIQLHYSRGGVFAESSLVVLGLTMLLEDKITHWETVTCCFIELPSPVFFEIGHYKESFSKESWYLRRKGTRDFWRTTTTTTKKSFQNRAILLVEPNNSL